MKGDEKSTVEGDPEHVGYSTRSLSFHNFSMLSKFLRKVYCDNDRKKLKS